MEKTMPQKIWEGKKKAFLISDESFGNSDAPLLTFLRSEGFTMGANKGNYGCHWIHVDITTKQYAYGMPGVELVGAIGNHAITVGDFMTIYGIYKKYENKDLFVFHEKPFDYDRNTKNKSIGYLHQKYWQPKKYTDCMHVPLINALLLKYTEKAKQREQPDWYVKGAGLYFTFEEEAYAIYPTNIGATSEVFEMLEDEFKDDLYSLGAYDIYGAGMID